MSDIAQLTPFALIFLPAAGNYDTKLPTDMTTHTLMLEGNEALYQGQHQRYRHGHRCYWTRQSRESEARRKRKCVIVPFREGYTISTEVFKLSYQG